MSLQICIKCRDLGMTWWMGDDNRTFWHCSECDFEIEEDESKVCLCGVCKSPDPSVSFMIDGESGYYWCFKCNSKTEKTIEDKTDYDEIRKILENEMS